MLVRRSDEFWGRLKSWIQEKTTDGRAFYRSTTSGETIYIEEKTRGGEASVAFVIPDGCAAIEWSFESSGLMNFLQEAKTADGAIMLHLSDGAFEAHIIECKKTVDQSKWSEINKQFRGTLGRLLALCGVLEIEFSRVIFATAFRKDQLSEEESPNPAQGKPMLGVLEDTQEHNQAMREQLGWMRDEVRVSGFKESFRHVKIRLDGEGRGRYSGTSQA